MILQLQNAILEMIAKGEPLADTIERLCVEVEAAVPGISASVLMVQGPTLHTLAVPSLAAHYSAAINNMKIGPLAGSCGTAAHYGHEIVVTDIETDPRWHDFRDLVLPLGFKACWSTPIRSGERVVGTFAFYYREHRGPSPIEEQIVEACVHLCAIAIERNERVQERQRLTYTDALTGLPNRAHFNRALALELVNSAEPWGILLADIDNLKLVNDTFGHAAGDTLIQVVANRMSAIVAPQSAFRLGGDEFAVIVHGETATDLASLAEQIRAALSPSSQCDGHVLFPAATIGGAFAGPNCNPEQIRQNADLALYHAKEHNRGGFVEYHPGLGTAITRRFRAIRDVSVALAEDRIDAHYQPIVRLDTRETVGFEALCRMTTRSGDIIAAANFHEATKDAHVCAATIKVRHSVNQDETRRRGCDEGRA